MSSNPWQERVVEERDELMTKITKLEAFLGTDPYQDLTQDNRDLLDTQFLVMMSYNNILAMRISKFD